MDETMTAQAGTNETQATEETTPKTFTQEEVNKIISERLSKEKSKYEGYAELKAKAEKFDAQEEANKSELQKAQEKTAKLEAELKAIKVKAEKDAMLSKISEETGVPIKLLDGENEEAIREKAQAILDFAKPKGYPNLADGGENSKVGKPTNAQLFEDWFNEQIN